MQEHLPVCGPATARGLRHNHSIVPLQNRLKGLMLCCMSLFQVGKEKIALGIPKALQQYSDAAIGAAIPLGRRGTPEEAAGAMLMLASPYSSYITGQVGFQVWFLLGLLARPCST